jgi:hypothetical protein
MLQPLTHCELRLHGEPLGCAPRQAPAPPLLTPSHHVAAGHCASPAASFVPHPHAGGEADGTQTSRPVQLVVTTLPEQEPLAQAVGVDTCAGPLQVALPAQGPVGYWQVPLPSQLVAPHGPLVTQAATQQSTLHTPLAHWLDTPHAWPGESRHPLPALSQV